MLHIFLVLGPSSFSTEKRKRTTNVLFELEKISVSNIIPNQNSRLQFQGSVNQGVKNENAFF